MGNEALDDPSWSRDVDRVLFTGSIRNMPSQIELLIEEGDLFLDRLEAESSRGS